MKSLVKVIIQIFTFFILLTFLGQQMDFLNYEKLIELTNIENQSNKVVIIFLVIVLLNLDILFSIPTMPLTLLTGFMLGKFWGAIAIILGLLSAGIIGFTLAKIYGEKILNFLVKNKKERDELESYFTKYGFYLIVFSRAIPMLPEVCSVMAGLVKMNKTKFITALLLSSIPYAIVVTFIGAQANPNNPLPVILFMIAFYALSWMSGYVLIKIKN